MTKEQQIQELANIDFCYNAQRNDIHAEFWKTRDVEKFSNKISEIQDLRYERIKALFKME